ncbi:unnamed protein product [Auanema sp. JU1783]|nr:unnamed protein product [Auanema sp. JU1783]
MNVVGKRLRSLTTDAQQDVKKPGMLGQKGLSQRRPLVEQRNNATQLIRQSLKPTERLVVQKEKKEIVRNEIRHPEIKGIEREISYVEFSDDVYKYLLHSEKEFSVDQGFMGSCTSVTPKMRAILVDWLVQVHQRFHLLPETLYLTIYLLDCVLANADVEKDELQLVGVGAMLVASKYEEMYAPDINDFEYITDHAFSKKQIIRVEMKVLEACSCRLSRPNALTFLRWLGTELGIAASKMQYRAKFFTEVSLLEYSLTHIPPSRVAVVALVLSCRMAGQDINLKKLKSLVNISITELEPAIKSLAQAVVKQQDYQKMRAIITKYGSPKNLEVSNFSADEIAFLKDLIH